MIRIWFLYFIVVSNVTETPLHSERIAFYYDKPSCVTAMQSAKSRISESDKEQLIDKTWGKNVRREFDCLSFLVGTDESFSRGVKPSKELLASYSADEIH